jgi:branched-chain amino acid transport system substrate-binding protein
VRTILVAAILMMFSFLSRAEIGVTENEILIGVVNPITGSIASSGLGLNAGVNVAVERINRGGGIHGRKIQIVHYDDVYEPAKTREFTNKLIDVDKVFALMTYNGSPTVIAALPIVVKADIPFLFPRAGDQKLRTPTIKSVINLKPSYDSEMSILLNSALSIKGKKVAIVYQPDALGDSLRAAAVQAIQEVPGYKSGKPFVAVAPIPRASPEDAAEAFKIVEAANPDVVVLAVSPPSAAPFVKLASDKKKKWTFVAGSNNTLLGEKIPEVDADILIALGFPHPQLSDLKVVKDFLEDMKTLGKSEQINFLSIEGYLDMRMAEEALRRVGRNLTRSALISAFEDKPFEVGDYKVEWSKTNHAGTARPIVFRIKSGKIVNL